MGLTQINEERKSDQHESTDVVVCRGSQESYLNEASLPAPHIPPSAVPSTPNLVFRDYMVFLPQNLISVQT